MIQYFRRHLVVKLFLTYLAVILVGMLVLVGATQFALPTAFNRHMGVSRLNSGGMTGRVFGPIIAGGQGTGPGMMRDLYSGFRASFNDALLWAILVAGLLALVVSVIFSRRIVAPL